MKRLILRYRRAADAEDVVREDITPVSFVFVLGKGKTPVIIAVSELVADARLVDDATGPEDRGSPGFLSPPVLPCSTSMSTESRAVLPRATKARRGANGPTDRGEESDVN